MAPDASETDNGWKHIVNFSGGAGSWAAARRVAERYGQENTTLLTANTGSEAEDWEPFVRAAAEDVGAELVMVSSDKYTDIWDSAMKRKIMPSIWRGFCTVELKIVPMEKWKTENCDPETTTTHFGYDWTEEHRLLKTRQQAAQTGWPHIDAPLLWDPVADKNEILKELEASKLPFPRAYKLGLSHNNCLATGCFKQGERAWVQLLRTLPDVYAHSESKEQDFIAMLQHEGREHKKVGMIYRRPRKGDADGRVMTLQDLREEIEQQPDLFATADGDWGACGCVY